MKRILTLMLSLAVLIGFATDGFAKKREPSKRDVEKTLEKIGGEHFPEDMKIKDVGSIEVGDDEYYHIFSGKLDDDAGYHLIIFDNVPSYVGFYRISGEPMEVGEEVILIDVGVIDPVSGAPLPKEITLDSTGPAARIQIGGMPSKFVTPPEPEVEEEAAPAMSSSSSSAREEPGKPKKKPEYRSWNVTVGDKVVKVESAIFVRYKDGRVTIKDAKTGRSVSRPVSDFSAEDKAYLQDLLQ